jgi:hypothetical protein
MKNMRKFWIPIGAVLLLGIAAYLPTLGYIGYRLGISGDAKIDGVEIEMKDSWYPALHSDSLLGHFLLRTMPRPTVVFAKISPGRPGTVGFLTFSLRTGNSRAEAESTVAFTNTYPWGEARFIRREITRTPDEQLVVIPKFGLEVTADDRKTLERNLAAITALRKH